MSGPQLERLILEVGMGNDLYGEDYTKAALRAVQDALHHSSLTLFRSPAFNFDPVNTATQQASLRESYVASWAAVLAKSMPKCKK